MSDGRYTAQELAELLGGRLEGDGALSVKSVNSLEAAASDEVTFIHDIAHAKRWRESSAKVLVVTEGVSFDEEDDARAVIHVRNAEHAVFALLGLWKQPEPQPDIGVHESAQLHPDARLGENVCIGPHVSVGARAVIGGGTVLHAGVRVYDDVSIGEDSVLHSNCVVRERCAIGARVTLHANVVIGTDGFGYRPAEDGSGLVKAPHIGTVEIGDEVEIGTGTCVDRGKFGATVIGRGTKIDNLCQIAHNCRIGSHCGIAAQTGLSGSVTVGDWVMMGGGAGVTEHRHIGDGAQIAARSAVMNDVPAGERWGGLPAKPASVALREQVALRKLPVELKRLSKLQKQVDERRYPAE